GGSTLTDHSLALVVVDRVALTVGQYLSVVPRCVSLVGCVGHATRSPNRVVTYVYSPPTCPEDTVCLAGWELLTQRWCRKGRACHRRAAPRAVFHVKHRWRRGIGSCLRHRRRVVTVTGPSLSDGDRSRIHEAPEGTRWASMGVRTWIESWPVYRQITGDDPTGRGDAAKSEWSEQLSPRTEDADRVVKSVCPYCAVGCGQNVYVKDEEVIQIEGDPDSPISRGRLCPKGSATLQLTTGDAREDKVLYRRPYGTDWEELDLDTAMEMVADRVVRTREETWEEESNGRRVARTL